MTRKQLYEWIKKRKVAIAVVVGLLVLILCLAITYNYFGLPDWDKSKLFHFAQNLANVKDGDMTLEDWICAQKDTIEQWYLNELDSLKENVKEEQRSLISKITDYLDERVPWGKTILIFLAYIVGCLLLFENLRSRLAPIFGEDRAPFNWKLNTGIISKFQNITNWKTLATSFEKEMGEWTGKQIDQLNEKLMEELKQEGGEAAKDLAKNIYGKIYLADLEQVEFGKIFSEKFGPELSEGSLIFLIDRISPGDHFALCWAVICQALVNKNFPVKYYFYQGDPRICFDETGNCATILDLVERHPQASLLIVGDGNTLIQSSHLALNPWTTVLENWQKRILFTPINAYTWNKREDLLGEIFHLLPAKLSSLQYINEILINEDFKFNIESHAEEHIIDYEEDIIDEKNLDKYFSNTYSKGEEIGKPHPVLDWIQSCAVPRKLDFQLSLELGKASFDRKEGADFNPEVILSVFQLPWFRQGIIPEQFRVLIAKKFEEESTKASEEIRKLLQIKIPQWKQPEGSEAAASLEETRQINEWKIKDPKPDKITRAQVKKELNRIYDQGLQPDGILEITDGYHNTYSKYFPAGVRPYIFSHGYSGLGLNRRFRNVLYSLLAGLVLFLIYFIILWLSRPILGPPADCPPCDYRCIPITKFIGATQTCQKKITLTGTEDQPLLAHLAGVEDDCCTPIDAMGSNVQLMIGEESISWGSGDSIPNLAELKHGQTLRMLIKGHLDITLSDSAALTIFVPIFDTVKARVIHLSHDQCSSEEFSCEVGLSRSLEKCLTLRDTIVIDSFVRRDTPGVASTRDTTIYALIAHCLQPKYLEVDDNYNREVWFEYKCDSVIDIDTIFIRDECDTIYIRDTIKIIDCPGFSFNLRCLGLDLVDLKERPTITINKEIVIDPQRLSNPIDLNRFLRRGPRLVFDIMHPYRFSQGDSSLIILVNQNTSEIGLDILPILDSILQVNGDIVIASRTNIPKDILRDSLRVYHYYEGDSIPRDTINLNDLTYCSDLEDFGFCGSRIQVEWKGDIVGTKLIRHYKSLLRCHNIVCADYSSIVIDID